MRHRRAWAPLALCLVLCGCATQPSDAAGRARFREANDPLEPLNRRVFALNQGIDKVVFKPIAQAYLHTIPAPGRDALRNVVLNIGEPVVFANDVLQLRLGAAARTTGRFLINSTFGVAGLADVATKRGLPRQMGDFGQTLYRWGAGDGPYLVIPVLGPANLRDAIGRGTDGYLDPFRYVAREDDFASWVRYGPLVVGGIDERARNIDTLDAVQKDAVDFYASLRSLYRQHRAAEIRGAESPPGQQGLYDDPELGTSK